MLVLTDTAVCFIYLREAEFFYTFYTGFKLGTGLF